jgi:hypothetical protein
MHVNRGSTGVDEWLGHDGVVESRSHHQMRWSGDLKWGTRWGKQVYSGGIQVRKVHGN